MSDVLSDDALFTKKTVVGNAPTGKDIKDEDASNESSDCGCGCGGKGDCGRSGTVPATVYFKRSLYEIIEDSIKIYDEYDDADQISEDMMNEIENVQKVIRSLRVR
jgi:hypothetical protein